MTEEKNLREIAENKALQMKKKLAEMKRVLAMFTTTSEDNNNLQSPSKKTSTRAFSSCDNFKAILDEDDAENDRAHRKTTSLFSLDDATRHRSNSIGADSSISQPNLPPTIAKPSIKIVTKEKPFSRPPLPTCTAATAIKQRKESHESISSTFSDLCAMENVPVKLVTSIGDNFTEYDTCSSIESLTSKSQQPTSAIGNALSAFDPMATSATEKLEAFDSERHKVISDADPFEELACRRNAVQLSFDT